MDFRAAAISRDQGYAGYLMPSSACLTLTAIYYIKDNWLCQPLAAKTWAKNKSGAKVALLAADAAEQAEAGIPILI